MLDIEAPKFSEFETQEKTEDIVIEMQGLLLKLGAYLAKQPKVCTALFVIISSYGYQPLLFFNVPLSWSSVNPFS